MTTTTLRPASSIPFRTSFTSLWVVIGTAWIHGISAPMPPLLS